MLDAVTYFHHHATDYAGARYRLVLECTLNICISYGVGFVTLCDQYTLCTAVYHTNSVYYINLSTTDIGFVKNNNKSNFIAHLLFDYVLYIIYVSHFPLGLFYFFVGVLLSICVLSCFHSMYACPAVMHLINWQFHFWCPRMTPISQILGCGPWTTSLYATFVSQNIIKCTKKTHETWKYLVWNLVNAQPMRRSSSWRASTDMASFLLGDPSVSNAFIISVSVIALNFARNIVYTLLQ